MTAAGALGRRGSGREPGPLPFLALLVPVVSLLVLLVPGAGAWCEAERVRLAEGELWRLAGAHLAHYSSAHWLLDASRREADRLDTLQPSATPRNRRRLRTQS